MATAPTRPTPPMPRLVAPRTVLVQRINNLINFDDVAAMFEVKPSLLRWILYGAKFRRRYTEFDIPKAGGGTRRIQVPPKNLRILQQKLNCILSAAYSPRMCVHGFATGCSVRTNAGPHERRRWVLNVDLRDFFGYVTIGRIVGSLNQGPLGIPIGPATVLAQIACMDNGRLPQGSACSPILSNIVAYGLDTLLVRLAKQHHCTYTRYADDISFSTSKSRFPRELARTEGGVTHVGDALRDAVLDGGFHLQSKKSRLQHRNHRQDVTGLTVNEFPNVRRSYVRSIRGMIHSWRKHGYDLAEEELNRRHDTGGPHLLPLNQHLRGKLAFLESVRGRSDPLVRRLLKDLRELESDLVPEIALLDALQPTALRGYRTPSLDWERIFERVRKSVVFLEIDDPPDKRAGTAFRVAEGAFATAGHNLQLGDVCAGLTKTVPLEIKGQKTIGHGVDVGLLEVADKARLRGPSLLSQVRLPQIGEQVAAIGFPTQPLRDPAMSLLVGVVESLPVSYQSKSRFIQVSFQSPSGLSGAPLIDRGGYVVGIMVENTWKKGGPDDPPARAFGQAVPYEYFYDFWRRA